MAEQLTGDHLICMDCHRPVRVPDDRLTCVECGWRTQFEVFPAPDLPRSDTPIRVWEYRGVWCALYHIAIQQMWARMERSFGDQVVRPPQVYEDRVNGKCGYAALPGHDEESAAHLSVYGGVTYIGPDWVGWDSEHAWTPKPTTVAMACAETERLVDSALDP